MMCFIMGVSTSIMGPLGWFTRGCSSFLVAQVEDATNFGFGVGLAEVRCVVVQQENHMALVEPDGCIWV